MKPKPSSNIVVTGHQGRKAPATRDQNEKARLLRMIAQAHTNWKRKMGMIPTEAESESQP